MPDPPTSSFRPLPPRMYSCSRSSLSDGLVSPRCVVIGPPRSLRGFRTLSDFQSSSARHLLRRRRHGDLIFPDVHLDIILFQTGQVGPHDELVVTVVYLNIGCPHGGAGIGEQTGG